MKCGGHKEVDWVTDFRALAFQDGAWKTVLDERNLPRPQSDEHIIWYDVGGLSTTDFLLEARRTGIDGWWSCWNVASSCFVLEGDVEPSRPIVRNLLDLERIDLTGVPTSVRVERLGHEVRYRTPFLEVGFSLYRPGPCFFGIDGDDNGNTGTNLLKIGPVGNQVQYLTQGVHLQPLGGPRVAGYLDADYQGSARVEGNVVEYTVHVDAAGQRYRLRWEVLPDRLLLWAERSGAFPIRAWDSAALHLAFDARVTPVNALGKITRCGEAGCIDPPVLLDAPGYGRLLARRKAGSFLWRSDSIRPLYITTAQVKLGEKPQPEGDYFLPAGTFQAEIEFAVHQASSRMLSADAPSAASEALRRHWATGLTYRADTATLSNNGNSIHAPMCADTWAYVCTRLGDVVPGVRATDFLRHTVERWLDGAPGYASGPTSQGDHRLEDEYLMTGAACLHAVAWYLESTEDRDWLRRCERNIRVELERMAARDLDGDGLVESPHRTGVSGKHEWSTNWYDVISFGWKDAFVNAILYGALRRLDRISKRLETDFGLPLEAWADELKESFHRSFFIRLSAPMTTRCK